MAVGLADILDAKQCAFELGGLSRDEALRAIVETMVLAAPEKFLGELSAREEVQTTLMAHGVAFPHTRTNLVEEIKLGIGRSANGIAWSENGDRASLIFVIGVPQRKINDYLVCVGALARLTKTETTRAELMRANSAAEFVEILRAGSLLLE